MKRNLLVIVCLISSVAFGQYRPHGKPSPKKDADGEKETPVNYSDLMDNPDKCDKLMIGLNLLGLDIHEGFDMGWGLSAKYNMSEKLMFDFDIFRPYAGVVDSQYGEINPNNEKLLNACKVFLSGDVGGTYFFKSFEDKKDIKVQLKSESGGYNVVIVHLLQVPAIQQKRLGVRGGLSYFQTTYNFPVHKALPSGREDTLQIATFGATSLYTGFAFSKIYNKVIKIEGYGQRTIKTFKTHAIDLGYSLANSFHAYYNGDTNYAVISPAPSVPISKLFVRYSYDGINIRSNKNIGSHFGFYIGMRPKLGDAAEAFFMGVRFGLVFTSGTNKS